MEQKIRFELSSDKNIVSKTSLTERAFRVNICMPDSTKQAERSPLNIALIIDRSGSMSGEKLAYARNAAAHVVSLLQGQDHVSVITFDNNVQIVSPSMQATPVNKSMITQEIMAIREGGSTNLSGGWLSGCQLIASTQTEKQLCRAILLTDGQANAGITDITELSRHATELASRGISTSTFGIGLGFNEHLLEEMSTHGRGNFHYIADPSQIPALFAKELGELSEVLLRQAEVEITVPNAERIYALGGYEQLGQGDKITIRLADLYASQVLDIFAIGHVSPQADGSSLGCSAVLRAMDTEQAKVELRSDSILTYGTAKEEVDAPYNPEFMKLFSEIYMADLTNEALKMERLGQGKAGEARMKTAMADLSMHMSPDVMSYYSETAKRIGSDNLEEMERKNFHQDQFLSKRMRK